MPVAEQRALMNTVARWRLTLPGAVATGRRRPRAPGARAGGEARSAGFRPDGATSGEEIEDA